MQPVFELVAGIVHRTIPFIDSNPPSKQKKDTPDGVPQANIKIQAAEAVSENHLVNHQPVSEDNISQSN